MPDLHLPHHFFLAVSPVRQSRGQQDLDFVAAQDRMRIDLLVSSHAT